ncbi:MULTISPECIES: DUF982 domain-containing protein [unclassified Mesorhizobium]|uniref:DUF982 domain-containing protein n=1 Tax=unclassified Mesorhizobium TaxID=325217 RepID=UPI0004830532|nr:MULTISPECIES: DUF982 domain-containing protein [unclassified Mesorhizobium]PBC21247.1 DUF982 domain-containing protein [Mesorhizobium sp. WSM4311]TRD04823.1 DUF982 domain-containing protein [Mesorhizobium sp. WSM4305]
MQDQRFDMPVSVALGRSGNTVYKVERVAQAADILLNRWPFATGKSHVAARKACLAALEGIKEASVARAAFVKAATDADILRENDHGRG